MTNKIFNNIKLGAFVLGGLVFLVLMLYLIGKNSNLFGNTYLLHVKFENIQGLVAGNNVRFSGIQAGTVKKVSIINDTVIEVSLFIDTKMKNIIRKNAIASIGTDGLVGNKVVNIAPAKLPAPFAEEGDYITSKKGIDTDDMLQTLNKTNNDIATITSELKLTTYRINKSSALWALLNDESIPKEVRGSLSNIRTATEKAGSLVNNLNAIILKVKRGEGSLGTIINDTAIAKNLNEAIVKIKAAGNEADLLANELSILIDGIEQDINSGKGMANALLKDSSIVHKINSSLENIQKGTEGFNQNMEALKHNFLLRGYFRKLERKKEKINN